MYFPHYLDPRFPPGAINVPSPDVWWSLVVVSVLCVLGAGAFAMSRASPGRQWFASLLLTPVFAVVVGCSVAYATRYYQAPLFSFDDTEERPFFAILVSPTDEPDVDLNLSFRDHCVVVMSETQWNATKDQMPYFVPPTPLRSIDGTSLYHQELRTSTTIQAYSRRQQVPPKVVQGLGPYLVAHCGSERAKELWNPPTITIDQGSSHFVLIPSAGSKDDPPLHTTLDGSACGWVAQFDLNSVHYRFSEHPDRVVGPMFALKDVPEGFHGAVLVAAVDPAETFADGELYISERAEAQKGLAKCMEELGITGE